jgi:hypothetical protein
MATGIVELFEVVDVDHQDSEGAAIVAASFPFVVECFVQMPTVTEPSQRVGLGE